MHDTNEGRGREMRLTIREWILITGALVSAMAAWVPKGILGTTSSPEVVELRNEINIEQKVLAQYQQDIREQQGKINELLLDIEKLRGRIFTLEHQAGYDASAGDGYQQRGRKTN